MLTAPSLKKLKTLVDIEIVEEELRSYLIRYLEDDGDEKVAQRHVHLLLLGPQGTLFIAISSCNVFYLDPPHFFLSL